MVSVIIPYYNRPEKLKRAIASIYNQTYQDFEIIVIDDNSQYPPFPNTIAKVNYIKNKINKGPGYSRNIGLQNAKGDYISFLDSDDYWHPLFLQKCIERFKNCSSELAFVYSNTMLVSNGKEKGLSKNKTITETKILPSIIEKGRSWDTGACLWNSKIVKNHSGFIEARNWEDYAFDVEAATICNNIKFIKEPLFFCETQGDDKLSKQKGSIVFNERAKSVIYISKTLMKSPFFTTQFIKKRIQVIILSTFIGLIDTNSRKKRNYGLLLNQLKKWAPFHIFFAVKTISLLDKKNALRLLRRLRKKIILSCADF